MTNVLLINQDPAKPLPAISAGDTVRVYQKIKEGDKSRTQIFEGLVIARKHGKQAGATITVRKISNGIGVERIFPLHLPTVEKIELIKKSKVRRAKLYYLRQKSTKETRRKLKTQEMTATAIPEAETSSSDSKVVESKSEE